MKLARNRGRQVVAVALLLTMTALASSAGAGHISVTLDRNRLRDQLGPNEGLLHFRDGGEETTGWTDVRAPSLAGPRDNVLGYDRSDHFVNVRTTVLNDGTVSANPQRARDFDFANQIYSQVGLSIIERETRNYVSATNPAVSFDFPLDGTERGNILAGLNGTNPVSTIETYYAKNTVEPYRGVTRIPEGITNPGVFILDSAVNDTFAHEVGHFLLDKYKFTGTYGPGGHSSINTDLMATGRNNFRNIPGSDSKGDGNTAPRKPGQRVGNIGTVSHFDEPVKFQSAGVDIDQLEAIAKSATINKLTHNPGAGDHVDFDWVQDHIPIEVRAPSADNHPSVDFMVWEIGALANSIHNDHDHNFWSDGDETEDLLEAYTGSSFHYADVVSQIARYADQDVAGGNWSRRESALDYLLDFSADGQTWIPGTPTRVFTQGWTVLSEADDYLVRWKTTIDARFVRIAAFPLGGDHDGNAQIDAIIVADQWVIPEPGSLTLVASGLLCVGLRLTTTRRRERLLAKRR